MEKVKAISAAAGSDWSDTAPLRSPVPPTPPIPPAPASGSAAWATSVPTSASTPAAPTPDPSVSPTAILDQLVASVDGVRGAILASVDGFGLASSSSMASEAAHPAMLAAAVGLAHQLVEMGGGTQLRQLLVAHDGGLLLVWPIAGERVLAVLASNAVDQLGVRSFVHRRADELAMVAT